MHSNDAVFDSVWWLHPGKLILLFILPVYAFVVFVVPNLWPELIVLRAPVYMNPEFAALGAAAIVVVGVMALLGASSNFDAPRQRLPGVVDERFLITMAVVTLGAYAVWFWPVLARGDLFLSREDLNRTPGVTSFTQFGVAFVVGFMLNAVRARDRPSLVVRVLFLVILFLTFARVYLHSERLAAIELVLPIAAIGLAHHQPRRAAARWLFSVLRRYGPVLGLPALLVFFAATEFVRSWRTYSRTQDISMLEFMVSRVATYYYTALNNGAGLLATSEWPSFEPIHVLDWAYRLPLGIGEFLWDGVPWRVDPSGAFLERFADPEFNNMSGIFPIFFDVGVPAGLVYFAVLGLAMGVAYRGFRHAHPLGSLIFPSLLVACSELLRITYLNDARCFLVLVGAAVASTQLRPRRPSLASQRVADVAEQGFAQAGR